MNIKQFVGGGIYSAPEIRELSVRIETGFAVSGVETEGIDETPGEWD